MLKHPGFSSKFTILASLFFLTSCSDHKAQQSAHEGDFKIPSKPLPVSLSEFPESRYLSAQWWQNRRPEGSTRGYDPDYRMLNFTKLEGISPNPDSEYHPDHMDGVRKDALVIRRPTPDEVDSRTFVSNFLIALKRPNTHFRETMNKLETQRHTAISESPAQPRVVVSGLGPVGILTVLEAYVAGASVIGVETRSQYTRPQILRLTPDTIERVKYFAGVDVWEYLREEGIVSQSPNWVQNKFDLVNGYLYPRIHALETKIRRTNNSSIRSRLKADLRHEKQLAKEKFTHSELDLRNTYKNKGLDLEDVDIIRINHLETLLAAIAERLAKQDPEHLRIYYGANIKVTGTQPSYSLQLEITSEGTTSTHAIEADILAISEGAGSQAAQALHMQSKPISNMLYGATVALRLPQGFDIGLRPIENKEGTASVVGIAKIDPQKLTKPGQSLGRRHYTWTMIEEHKLCEELNTILSHTADSTHYPSAHEVLLPCDLDVSHMPNPKRIGGENTVLPRTRYFFTAGIAYMGAEVTKPQFEMFHTDRSDSPAVRENKRSGLKEFMLILAKKHMPREYVEGQGLHKPLIAQEAEGESNYSADRARVVMLTEEKYSLTVFPIQLRKGTQYYFMENFIDGEHHRPVRVVAEGDTYGTTHFFTGSGAVNGLRAAILFGLALQNGNTQQSWDAAAKRASEYTDDMHHKVIDGEGNAPLDGPYNERL